jgi:hypothetical protein
MHGTIVLLRDRTHLIFGCTIEKRLPRMRRESIVENRTPPLELYLNSQSA